MEGLIFGILQQPINKCSIYMGIPSERALIESTMTQPKVTCTECYSEK